jgi:hypothetical protein
MDKQKRLHEISMNLFNGDHESIEHAIDAYTEEKKSKIHFRWAIVFTLVSTILLANVIGMSRYEKMFEAEQKEYFEAVNSHFKSQENRINVYQKVIRMHQYFDDMNIKPEYERTND